MVEYVISKNNEKNKDKIDFYFSMIYDEFQENVLNLLKIYGRTRLIDLIHMYLKYVKYEDDLSLDRIRVIQSLRYGFQRRE